MANKRKLKNFLINPRYQLKYIFWLGTTGLVLTLINCTIFYVYIRENYSTLVELVPMTDEVKSQLYSELHHIVLILALVSLVFLALVATLGMVISHRTAGPMYHLKRICGEIAEGRRDARVRLRPSDDFQDVGQAFNHMVEILTKRG